MCSINLTAIHSIEGNFACSCDTSLKISRKTLQINTVTHKICSGTKQDNTTLYQTKTGKHDYGKIAAILKKSKIDIVSLIKP